jgi:hypothetical protein
MIFLNGCFFSNKEPIFVEQISVYQEGNLLSGTLYFHDGSEWVLYDQNNKDQKNVYMSFIVSEGIAVEIYFDTYSPDKEIHDMKLTLSNDLDYMTNISEGAVILDRDGDIVQSSFIIEPFSSELNVISIYGWWTSDGPNYVGAKPAGAHYVLKGVRLLFESDNA